MVGDLGRWINLQSGITTVVGSLLLAAVYWTLKVLGKRYQNRRPPNPITEESNVRLRGLLDDIERENRAAIANLAAAKTTIKDLEQQLVDEKVAHKKAIAEYDARCSEMQLALAQMAIRNSRQATRIDQQTARIDQLEAAYTQDTGKVLPAPVVTPTQP